MFFNVRGVWMDFFHLNKWIFIDRKKKNAAGHAGFCDWGSAEVDCRFTNRTKQHVWRTVVPRKQIFSKLTTGEPTVRTASIVANASG